VIAPNNGGVACEKRAPPQAIGADFESETNSKFITVTPTDQIGVPIARLRPCVKIACSAQPPPSWMGWTAFYLTNSR